MKRIRGGMGLGDSLYMQSVVRHLLKKGEQLEVCTKWPEIFRYLPVRTRPFDRKNIHILAHYTSRKGVQGTTQFEDVCISAGIREPVELRLDWKVTNQANLAIFDQPKPVVCVQMARKPMSRTDGIGMCLLPDCGAIQRLIDALRDVAFVVQIGSGEPLHQFKNLSIDLVNKTDVCGLLDIASQASLFVGYPSTVIPLAESFGKGGLYFWSKKVFKDRHSYIRNITPEKLMHHKNSVSIFDDELSQKNIDRFISRLALESAA